MWTVKNNLYDLDFCEMVAAKHQSVAGICSAEKPVDLLFHSSKRLKLDFNQHLIPLLNQNRCNEELDLADMNESICTKHRQLVAACAFLRWTGGNRGQRETCTKEAKNSGESSTMRRWPLLPEWNVFQIVVQGTCIRITSSSVLEAAITAEQKDTLNESEQRLTYKTPNHFYRRRRTPNTPQCHTL